MDREEVLSQTSAGKVIIYVDVREEEKTSCLLVSFDFL
jgi:hypothetical protein